MTHPPIKAERRPTICFIVTGAASARHVDMLHLSLMSVRRCEADARVCLVTDRACEGDLSVNRSSLLDLCSEVVVENSIYDDPVKRSRDLRIRLRSLVSGRLLYVDGDTLFVRPVGGIPEINTCVAAVCDFNYTPVKAIRKAVPSEVAAAVGSSLTSLGLAWPSSSFNAGVFLMEDTPEAGQFAARWLEVWNRILNCNDPRVVHLSDQIAFNLTCDELRNSVGTLANRYNTMVPTSPQLTSIASILHFFGSPAQIQGTLLEHLLMRFKETGCLDESAIERCLREGHPWGPHPEAWRYMRSGNVVRAALAKARRTMGFP